MNSFARVTNRKIPLKLLEVSWSRRMTWSWQQKWYIVGKI